MEILIIIISGLLFCGGMLLMCAVGFPLLKAVGLALLVGALKIREMYT